MPTAASRARSAGVCRPLSPTITLAGGTRGASRSLTASEVLNILRSRLLMPISRERSLQRAVELGLVVHLDQHVHAERERGVLELAGAGVVDRRP